MKQRFNVWLPDADEHFEQSMARTPLQALAGRMVGTYQKDKLDAAVAKMKQRRTAIDAGAHCGFFSMWLSEAFKRVIAFEPVPEHVECFLRNAPKAELIQCALGAGHGYVNIKTDAENSGRAHVEGSGDVEMISIDSLRLNHVDFIKIDVEGFEPQVIEGAADTIQRCRPVIVFEDKGFHERAGNEPNAALIALLKMGMKIQAIMGADYVMKWAKK